MKAFLVAILMLAVSQPSSACDVQTPEDFIDCYVQAFNAADAEGLSRLLAPEFTVGFVNGPSSVRMTKSQEVEANVKMWNSSNMVDFLLTLAGDLVVTDLGSGRSRVEGIESSLTVTASKMEVGAPGTYTIMNVCTWELRETTDGYELITIDIWQKDPTG